MINQLTTRSSRHGFSIIEVLTAIVVAMIGVFGVMSMIPFAVRQAQTGLDQDAATISARNAYAQFEIGGYRNSALWAINGTPTFVGPTDLPRAYSIDPLAITENGNYTTTRFPINWTGSAAPCPHKINPVNLRTPAGAATIMLTADARRMFRTADDLVFGEPDELSGLADPELNGPQQIFDKSGGNNMRRQAVGGISWSALAVPDESGSTSQANKYRMFILVYKDRVTDVGIVQSDMLAAKVASPTTQESPVSTIELEAGISIPVGFLKKDDWVMLINDKSNFAASFQVGFYRIVNFDGEDPAQLTLDGPDFDFDAAFDTYVVHLKDVVGVYERSFVPESSSSWNLSN